MNKTGEIALATQLARARKQTRFRNYYRCPVDGTVWMDEWSCMCNDRCPKCNREIEPYDSEDC